MGKNKFKIFIVMLLFLLCIIIPGTKISADSLSGNYSLESAGGNRYIYNFFENDEEQRKLFNEIGNVLEDFISSDKYKTDLSEETAEITIKYELESEVFSGSFTNASAFVYFTETRIREVAGRFVYANPKYYWLKNSYSFENAISTVKENNMVTIKETVTVVYKVDPYYYTYESRKRVDDAISSKLDSWVNEITHDDQNNKITDTYMIALRAHDLVIRETDYAQNTNGTPVDEIWAHSIAGVFTGQGSVCEGYSKMYEYLLDLAGVNNVYIIGTGNGEPHAWNAVTCNDGSGNFFPVDVTWDDPVTNAFDPEGEDQSALANIEYTYFGMRGTSFRMTHEAYGSSVYDFYRAPTLSEGHSFYDKYKCIIIEAIKEDSYEAIATSLIMNRYEGSDYIFAIVQESFVANFAKLCIPYITGEPAPETIAYEKTVYGCLIKFMAPTIKTPSTKIELSEKSITLEEGDSVTVEALLDKDSDDIVLWELSINDTTDKHKPGRYVRMVGHKCTAALTALKDGKLTLKATLYSSKHSGSGEPISAICEITVGEGKAKADVTVWQNGAKEYKTATITTKIKATNYVIEKESKKSVKIQKKKGKVIWFASDELIVPEFDEEKHSFSFGVSKSKNISVNPRGVVTAKTAGKAFVYVCDTGSGEYEEFDIDVLAAPSKISLYSKPGTEEKSDMAKKIPVNAGDGVSVYIVPFVKDGKADPDCTYTAKTSKKDQEKYVTIEEVKVDKDGYLYVEISDTKLTTLNKTLSVKIDVICKESGKKASFTLVIGNSVFAVKLTPKGNSSEKLEKKSDSVSYSLGLITDCGEGNLTTDKIKIYVGNTSVTLEGVDKPKAIADKGATVKAKFDSKTMTLTLTATRDAGATAIVAVIFTSSHDKGKVKLKELMKIDESGKITLFA